jgi:hypothetical protein
VNRATVVIWRPTPWGWAAYVSGQRHKVLLSVRRYRAGDGGLTYVPRVDGSGLASPAPAFRSLAAAKRAAVAEALRRKA